MHVAPAKHNLSVRQNYVPQKHFIPLKLNKIDNIVIYALYYTYILF